MIAKFLLGVIAIFLAIQIPSLAQSDAVERIEDAPPAPPVYSTENLIRIEMPPYVTLKIGVDPKTIEVTADGLVRYVVVMRSTSGMTTAAYEGVRCTKGEVKTYARVNSAGIWVPDSQAQWRRLADSMGSRHAQAIVQQGGCEGVVGGRREDVINALTDVKRTHYAN
jgi:hypothetical protein